MSKLIDQDDPLEINARKGGALDTLTRLARGYEVKHAEAVRSGRRWAVAAVVLFAWATYASVVAHQTSERAASAGEHCR